MAVSYAVRWKHDSEKTNRNMAEYIFKLFFFKCVRKRVPGRQCSKISSFKRTIFLTKPYPAWFSGGPGRSCHGLLSPLPLYFHKSGLALKSLNIIFLFNFTKSWFFLFQFRSRDRPLRISFSKVPNLNSNFSSEFKQIHRKKLNDFKIYNTIERLKLLCKVQ